MVRKLIRHPLHFILFLSFLLLVGIPILYTYSSILFSRESFFDDLQQFDLDTFSLLGKSILIAATIGVLATFLGTVLGFLLYKTNVKFKGFFKLALLIPLFISPYILAVAWKDFFMLVFKTSSFLNTPWSVIFVLTLIFTPLSLLITGSAFSQSNAQMEEAALLIIPRRKALFRIALTLIKPALLTSFILIFIFSISEFSVPTFFGVKVFTTEIFTQFSAFYKHSLAIMQSFLLVFICITLLYSERKHLADAAFLSIGNRGTKNKLYPLNQKSVLGILILSIWLLISVVLPFIVLIIQTVSGGTEKLAQAFKLLLPTLTNSIGLALIGALLIVIIGFSTAYSSYKNRMPKTTKIVDGLQLVVFALPATIFGISFILFYNRPTLNFIYASYGIVLIGLVGKFSFVATKMIGNTLKQIPSSLDEAAQIEGISPFSRLKNILFPLLLPTLFITFIISFIFCFGELGISIMVYPPGTELMPIKVFTIMANAPQVLVSAMTLIVFSITLLLISIFYLILKSQFNINKT